MESEGSMGDPMPIFYVGQHESKRVLPVSDDVVRQAQDCNVRESGIPSHKEKS